MSPRPLFRIASGVLEGNELTFGDRTYLCAGRAQFRGLWTRDFCFAARGLLALGRLRCVRDHLELLIGLRRPADGLVPRLVDSLSPAWLRVAHGVAVECLPFGRGALGMGEPLRPEYRSEHGVEAIDSNLLTLRTALSYLDATGDREWWDRHETALAAIFRYYEPHRGGTLLVQDEFADWQDSVRRDGRTFYTNLLYWDVARRLRDFPGFGVPPDLPGRIRHELFRVFFDPEAGLFRSVEDAPHVSVEGNLLAIDGGFLEGAEEGCSRSVYAALKSHPLWGRGERSLPGRATVPDYPSAWKSLPTRAVGLDGYHDRLQWSWLTALAANVAFQMDDREEAERILDGLERVVCRDGTVSEVHEPEPPYRPWRSALYRAERDFSWGAGMMVEALRRGASGAPVSDRAPVPRTSEGSYS